MEINDFEKILKKHFPNVLRPTQLLKLKLPVLKIHKQMADLKQGKFDSRDLNSDNTQLKNLQTKLQLEEENLFDHLGVKKYIPSETGVTFELKVTTSAGVGLFYSPLIVMIIKDEVKDEIIITDEIFKDHVLQAKKVAIKAGSILNPKPKSARLITNLAGLQTRPWEHWFIFMPSAGDNIGYPVFRGQEKSKKGMMEIFEHHLNGTLPQAIPKPLEKWLIKTIEQPE